MHHTQRYDKLFQLNDPKKGGSFYLQSKIYRSKEVLDSEFEEDKDEDEAEAVHNTGGKSESTDAGNDPKKSTSSDSSSENKSS